jgi:hypothetical protein
MRSLTFDKVFAMWSAVQLSASDLARPRARIASTVHPAECIAVIEQAAHGRPCPRCAYPKSHRCEQASGLQRFRCLGCGRTYNALATGRPTASIAANVAAAPPSSTGMAAGTRRSPKRAVCGPPCRRRPLEDETFSGMEEVSRGSADQLR